LGQYFPGVTTQQQPPKPRPRATAVATTTADPSCPTSELAPAGLAPIPAQCTTPNCLINFKGYQWWTSYNYYGPPFPQQSYFWNANNQWSPKNAFVDSEGLHLKIQTQDTGGGPKPSAAEVVAMFNADGSEANLGYGDYLVTAQVVTPAESWDKLDPNVAFGARRDRCGQRHHRESQSRARSDGDIALGLCRAAPSPQSTGPSSCILPHAQR
jgi:hypothetical protein